MKCLRIPIIALLLLLTACQTDEAKDKDDDTLLIYTSIYPLAYIMEEIAGTEADVQSIYPPGVDAHTYEPSSREITKMANADALIYLGAGMESFAETAADALQQQDIELIELGKDKTLFAEHEHDGAEEEDHEHAHHDLDPHVWLDPLRMIEMGEQIVKELEKLSPDNASLYEENFARFKENMLALDQEFLDTLTAKDEKDILVAHAAYGYWEDRYGIQQIAISGLSSSDEPSQKELTKIATLAKEKDIEYVIFDQSTSNRIATIIQEHIGAEKLEVHNLEVLTETDIENGEDYLSLMKKNLNVLDKATK